MKKFFFSHLLIFNNVLLNQIKNTYNLQLLTCKWTKLHLPENPYTYTGNLMIMQTGKSSWNQLTPVQTKYIN